MIIIYLDGDLGKELTYGAATDSIAAVDVCSMMAAPLRGSNAS